MMVFSGGCVTADIVIFERVGGVILIEFLLTCGFEI